MSCAKRSFLTTNVRNTTIQLTINIAKSGSLHANHHGDAQLLANAVSCSQRFAMKALQAIEKGNEQELFKCEKRRDSLLATDWPDKLEEFVIQPENSRAVPGKEQVSIRYGKRHTKFLLLKAKYEIVKEFKKINPDCPFGPSTLLREFPPYAVSPTSRDIQRNACPYHANARHLVLAINNILKTWKCETLPSSCRELVMKHMCNSEFSDIDPLTWNPACATCECNNCPEIKIEVPKEVQGAEIKFSQWETRTLKVRKKGKMVDKDVYSLYSQTTEFLTAISMLEKSLPKLRQHIFTAHKQWQAHSVLRENLDDSSVITVEDYQMNVTPKFAEQPTASGYAANKISFALYPICVEFRMMLCSLR